MTRTHPAGCVAHADGSGWMLRGGCTLDHPAVLDHAPADGQARRLRRSSRDRRAKTDLSVSVRIGPRAADGSERTDQALRAVLRGERNQLPHDAGCRFDPFTGMWEALSTCGEDHDIDHDAPGQPR